jgi:uncharacterized protein (DUF433 family)
MTNTSPSYEGIYEISEAARIIRATSSFLETHYLINNRHILRWIRNGLSLPALREVPGRELVISFADLISMRVIALLRINGVPWKKIHEAETWIRKNIGAPRPFATERFWTALREVFVDKEGDLLAASMGGQYPFIELLKDRLVPVAGLTFEDGIADSWTPKPIEEVLIKPTIQFGAPCIRGTRITTSTVWGMNQGGDSVDFIARVYHLEPKRVQKAIEWENYLVAAA